MDAFFHRDSRCLFLALLARLRDYRAWSSDHPLPFPPSLQGCSIVRLPPFRNETCISVWGISNLAGPFPLLTMRHCPGDFCVGALARTRWRSSLFLFFNAFKHTPATAQPPPSPPSSLHKPFRYPPSPPEGLRRKGLIPQYPVLAFLPPYVFVHPQLPLACDSNAMLLSLGIVFWPPSIFLSSFFPRLAPIGVLVPFLRVVRTPLAPPRPARTLHSETFTRPSCPS